MKRLFLILLAAVMVFSLAACGEDETTSNGGNTTSSESSPTSSAAVGNGTSTETPNVSSSTGNTNSKPTKEELLAQYGLTMEDLQPPGFIEMNAWACEKNEGDFFIQVGEASRGAAEIEEWFKKVFGKLKSLSDDGKIYQDPALTQEATYPSYNAYITDKQLLYNYKGQKVYVEMRFNQGFANLKDEIKNKAQYEFYINLYQ
jgi:uncharacterized lipoprotein YehR (DUF1307 family)